MKKFFALLATLVVLGGCIGVYMIYGSATNFSESYKMVLITQSNTNKQNLTKTLLENDIISNGFAFEQLGNQLKIWDRINEGKYKVTKGENLLNIVRMFRNNKQAEINLVINKIRLPQDLAKLIAKNFSTDSATVLSTLQSSQTLLSNDADSNSFLFNIIPNTYSFYWSTPVEKMIERLAAESKKFWSENNRSQQAAQLGLTPLQACIIASIVEEETNQNDEKGKVASVYINRLNKGMPLGADPTIKFALKDFSLKRILFNHLAVESPYNTYRNKGLPPGPICTPSIKTIDAVLQAPRTDYLFFVAEPNLTGHHHFSNNYAEHERYAKIYQSWLNKYMKNKDR